MTFELWFQVFIILVGFYLPLAYIFLMPSYFGFIFSNRYPWREKYIETVGCLLAPFGLPFFIISLIAFAVLRFILIVFLFLIPTYIFRSDFHSDEERTPLSNIKFKIAKIFGNIALYLVGENNLRAGQVMQQNVASKIYNEIIVRLIRRTITYPVKNPFVVGNPVTGMLFVGRDEIFLLLEELWGTDPRRQVPSVVLFGHRRMGKSSILQNLGDHCGKQTLVAYFTMQSLGKIDSTGELLLAFAYALFDTLDPKTKQSVPEPDQFSFLDRPYLAFNRFLNTLKPILVGHRLILTIDEFELIEEAILAGRVDHEVLEYLRGIIHSEPWFVLVLAGLHTLKDMTADYWNPLFASVMPISVSFLSFTAASNLLSNPEPGFPLNFSKITPRVYELVRGQPYLTQLIGYNLVQLYNKHSFDDGRKYFWDFVPDDVDAVIRSPEFDEQSYYYFNGVWSQSESPADGRVAILKALATADSALLQDDLIAATGLDKDNISTCLKTLEQHDVIFYTDTTDPKLDFTVPVMRWWIKKHKVN
jgi:hypothetical protein